MKTAIIGASAEALHTIKKAQEQGLEVLALDGDPMAAGLKAADRAIVADIADEGLVIEILKREKPDFLLSVPIGRYLTTTGGANDALGLPGISREMTVLCTDKLKFHERLHEAGLRQCWCCEWDGNIARKNGTVIGEAGIEKGEGRQAEDFLREQAVRFPAILKPRYGSGSRGIHMVYDEDQLKKALKETSGEPYVVEEWIAGEEYGVDAAVTKDGFQMVLLRRKENTPPPARQAVGYFSVPPSEEFWGQVDAYMKKAVQCLGLQECLLHADIIRSGQGPFAIELSARPSGHNLHNLFTPLCTGVDMAEEYIKYRMGLSYDFAPQTTRRLMIHYFDLEGKVMWVPAKEQVERALEAEGAKLLAWQCHIRPGEELRGVSDGHSLMGRGYFILESADREKAADGKKMGSDALLKEQAQKVKGLFGCSRG